jgi:hypothetical protein
VNIIRKELQCAYLEELSFSLVFSAEFLWLSLAWFALWSGCLPSFTFLLLTLPSASCPVPQKRMSTERFQTISDKLNFANEEENILRYWQEIDAFKLTLQLSEGRPEYTFYDGPPFATGLPHYG